MIQICSAYVRWTFPLRTARHGAVQQLRIFHFFTSYLQHVQVMGNHALLEYGRSGLSPTPFTGPITGLSQH